MTTQDNGAPAPSSIESINEPPGSEVLPEPKPKRKKKRKAKKAKKAKAKKTKKTRKIKAKKKKL